MSELDSPARLAQFKGAIVGLDADGVLDECVKEAAARAQAPMALVTFVMSKIQLFRAAVGLPPELEASRATSRCDSFCQFVVTTERPFVIVDAQKDDRVPQHLVKTYGIAAYLGVPIQVGGQVLGSLCVADGQPRAWPASLIGELEVLAARVSARLETLANPRGVAVDAPARDTASLSSDVSSLALVVQRSLVEVGPMVRLAKGISQGISPEALTRAASVLTEASAFYDDMLSAVAELCTHAASLERAVSVRAP
jgi:transcriptional regulator with GAF, ATPase, and Fis domain